MLLQCYIINNNMIFWPLDHQLFTLNAVYKNTGKVCWPTLSLLEKSERFAMLNDILISQLVFIPSECSFSCFYSLLGSLNSLVVISFTSHAASSFGKIRIPAPWRHGSIIVWV